VRPRLLAGGLTEPQTEEWMHRTLVAGDRRRGVEVRYRNATAMAKELSASNDALQRRVAEDAERLNLARMNSARYFKRMMTARDLNELAKVSVNHLPSDFGEYGMVILRDEGKWIGHAAGLRSDPGRRKTVYLDVGKLPKTRRGFLDRPGISSLTPEDLKVLPPPVAESIWPTFMPPKRVAVTKLGDNGYFVVFNPNEEINGSLLSRITRRALGAKGRIGALEAEKRKIFANAMATQALEAEKMKIFGPAAAHELSNPANNIGVAANQLLKFEREYYKLKHDLKHNKGMPAATRKKELKRLRLFMNYRLPDRVRKGLELMRDQSRTMGTMLEILREPDLKKTFKPTSVNGPVIEGIGDPRIIAHLKARGILPMDASRQEIREILLKNIHLSDGLPEINGTRGAITVIAQNLVRNAADAMEHSKEKKLAVSTERIEKGGRPYIRLSVSDTGAGIPEEARPRLRRYEVGFTTKKHRAGVEGGMGVGMALVKQLVDEHSGEIDFVTSTRKGKSGTTFHVDFPVLQESGAPGPSTPSPSPVRPA
jgi:signal transduction histidine kinase